MPCCFIIHCSTNTLLYSFAGNTLLSDLELTERMGTTRCWWATGDAFFPSRLSVSRHNTSKQKQINLQEILSFMSLSDCYVLEMTAWISKLLIRPLEGANYGKTESRTRSRYPSRGRSAFGVESRAYSHKVIILYQFDLGLCLGKELLRWSCGDK